MLRRLSQSELIGPTLASLAAFAVLVSLGTWQLQRMRWKEGLLARIEAGARAEPLALSEAIEGWRSGRVLEYRRVAATGRFRHDLQRLLYWPDAELGPGYHVYAPLETGPGSIVWINRGFIPEREVAEAASRVGQPDHNSRIVGLLRAPGEKGSFTPANDIARNRWYWRDLAGMHASAYPSAGVEAAPFFIDAEAGLSASEKWPKGGVTNLKLANRHLEYALTWYGLAATLIGVYVAFARARLSARRGPDG